MANFLLSLQDILCERFSLRKEEYRNDCENLAVVDYIDIATQNAQTFCGALGCSEISPWTDKFLFSEQTMCRNHAQLTFKHAFWMNHITIACTKHFKAHFSGNSFCFHRMKTGLLVLSFVHVQTVRQEAA